MMPPKAREQENGWQMYMIANCLLKKTHLFNDIIVIVC